MIMKLPSDNGEDHMIMIVLNHGTPALTVMESTERLVRTWIASQNDEQVGQLVSGLCKIT